MRKIRGSLRIDLCKLMTTPRRIFLSVRNVSGKNFRAIQNTHFILNTPSPPPENRAVYEVMWKSILEPGKSQMTIWRVRITCFITEATDTHSDYVIIITFPRQQWLRERLTLLRCACTLPFLLDIERNTIEAPSPCLWVYVHF